VQVGPHKAYRGAQTVSVVFKVASGLVLIVGTFSAIGTAKALHNNGTTGGQVTVVVIGVIGGTILAAAAFAFFAYVLDLLRGIETNTFARPIQVLGSAPITTASAPMSQIVAPTVGARQMVSTPASEDLPTSTRAPVYEPGWYADPHGVAQGRYWDGHEWTEHTTGGPEPSG
jgi:hypothetical protein